MSVLDLVNFEKRKVPKYTEAATPPVSGDVGVLYELRYISSTQEFFQCVDATNGIWQSVNIGTEIPSTGDVGLALVKTATGYAWAEQESTTLTITTGSISAT